MNKSKFLKRSLATLLAILMVVAMVPSAFAAEGDPVHQDLKITVDTYSATQTENGDYTVTVWDSNDVTINWAPISGTTLKLVTGGKNPNVVLDLPHKLYLAENANIEGDNTYSVTLREKVGTADAVDHKLTIKVESSIPDNNADLKAIRVDNTKGDYAIGYLTGSSVKGNLAEVGANGIDAHAIKGEIDNANETVTITLPFGMRPEDVGFDDSANGIQAANTTKAAAVFAPASVNARVKYEYDSTNINNSKVTVKAKTGAENVYTVIFKQEQIFESFTDSTNLSDLEKVPATGKLPELDVELVVPAAGNNLENYAGRAKNNWTAGLWVPEFTTTANVQRIMGNSADALDEKANCADAVGGAKLVYNSNAPFGEYLETDGANGALKQDQMLKLITSNHASWAMTAHRDDYVYLLVRTAANPSGAFVQINLKAVDPAKTKAYITELQADNTQSVTDISKDTRLIPVVVDNEHHFDAGNTGESNPDPNDVATQCTLRITTDNDAKITLPNLKPYDATTTTGWTSTSSSTASTRHFISGVNAKSGSVLVRVESEDGTITDYTVKFSAAGSANLGLKKIELRDKDGVLITSSTVGSKVSTPFELQVPYKYQAGVATTAQIDGDLADCELWVYPDEGAVVVPGNHGITNSWNTPPTAGIGDANRTNETETETSPFENSITKVGNVWVNKYTLQADGKTANTDDDTGAKFNHILNLTVSNKTNNSCEVYQVKLTREKPSESASITAVTANKLLDSDYLFSVATTLGTQIAGQTDIGRAYVGAMDKDGNALNTEIDETARTIKVQVPYDWDNDNDTLYLTGLTSNGEKVYRSTLKVDDSSYKPGEVTIGQNIVSTINQEDQTRFEYNGTNCQMGFTGLTTSPATTKAENILYVYSQKDWFQNKANGNDRNNYTPADSDALPTDSTRAYRVYIEKVGSANTGRQLNAVSATGATVDFRSTYDTITVSVPGSYNWTAFRADNSKDFKMHFDASTGAMIIDKGQYEANDKTANNTTTGALTATTGKYVDTRTGANTVASFTDASAGKEYQKQLNNYYDINDATFFVMDGELYVYDELSGKETRITGVGGANGKFTNSNWGEIKTKQAEIRVYNEAQGPFRTYRLDLKVGEPSNAKDIISLKVGDVTATKNGSSFTANLPEDAEKEQALTLELSDMATATVNGEPYQADRKIDVSKEVAIVVTAENGSKANFTLTTTFGDTPIPPDPDKPSSKYTDIPAAPMGDFVKEAIDKGLMVGTSATKFSPDMAVTRWQFTLIIARADVMAKNPAITNATQADAELQSQYSGTPKFDDTKNLNALYNAAIEYCNKNNIVSGIGNNKFDPNGKVTRLMAARMISDWTGLTDESKTDNTNEIKDWDKVNWGKHYVNSVYDAGLVKGYGDGTFKPTRTLSRAEAAVMLVGAFNYKTGAN